MNARLAIGCLSLTVILTVLSAIEPAVLALLADGADTYAELFQVERWHNRLRIGLLVALGGALLATFVAIALWVRGVRRNRPAWQGDRRDRIVLLGTGWLLSTMVGLLLANPLAPVLDDRPNEWFVPVFAPITPADDPMSSPIDQASRDFRVQRLIGDQFLGDLPGLVLLGLAGVLGVLAIRSTTTADSAALHRQPRTEPE